MAVQATLQTVLIMRIMIKKAFSAAFLLIYSISSHASSVSEIVRPVLVTPQATSFDESCFKDKNCTKKIEDAKALLTKIYRSFNEALYRENAATLKFCSTKFRASVDQNAQVFRRRAIGDAEQVISFAVQDFETMDAGKKLRLKIYTVLFTEGSLFFVQAHVTFISSTGNDKWQVDSYESIGK
jgi:hypothetical protein